MTREQKFKKMVQSARAEQNFNDLAEDRAILWAAGRIKTLEDEISCMKKKIHNFHIFQCEPGNCNLDGENCAYGSGRVELK